MTQNFNGDQNPYAPPEQRDLGLPAQEDDPGHVLATRGARLGAAILDWLFIVLSLVPGYLLVASNGDRSISGASSSFEFERNFTILIVIWFIGVLVQAY